MIDYADKRWIMALSDFEQRRLSAIEWLDSRWLLHPTNSPKKSTYDKNGNEVKHDKCNR